MKKMEIEQMECIEGGLSWGCAVAGVGAIAAFGAIAMAATPATAMALAWEAAAWMGTTAGFVMSCAKELGIPVS
jgi:hypothetical protein